LTKGPHRRSVWIFMGANLMGHPPVGKNANAVFIDFQKNNNRPPCWMCWTRPANHPQSVLFGFCCCAQSVWRWCDSFGNVEIILFTSQKLGFGGVYSILVNKDRVMSLPSTKPQRQGCGCDIHQYIQLNSTQLNRELRTQVSDTSKSAS